MRTGISMSEGKGAWRVALALVYDLTLLSFCILYLLSDLAMPLSEQLIVLIVCAGGAILSLRWLKYNGQLLDASSRWLCAFATAFVYWGARWVLLPEKFVPTYDGVPWQVPWASLLLCLRAVVFALIFTGTVLSPLLGIQSSGELGSVTSTSSVEFQMRLAILIVCVLITAYAIFMFVLLNARYPADMRIGYTISVLAKAWEMTALLLMSSHHPVGVVRRDIAMFVLTLTVLARVVIQAVA
ncbi:MAG: hypothetical protein RMK18_11090 [Armatimonadota bacterium]|nr:hypothetical protein [Armatimonadota bacterium]MCX7778329.1 hypothetical protein [Armatimonadota bacterium]MDW8026392.1 hypothetical protein [Armatimonadota bacterium]